ncbi:hypothetical protein PIB30_090402 [Stylosanthes scabra]|uniref:Uncharacterized protein n=1 Tax=Stylosanthes scabra TaxID=79078 RepID=A0ABU6XUI6_9FABA|nr:hypothetical protein [Stylosanthes scabra]
MTLCKEIKDVLRQQGIYLRNWIARVQDQEMITTLNNGDYGDYPQTLRPETEFLRFARNCIAHSEIYQDVLAGWDQFNVNMYQQAETLAEAIEDVYPGFLCALHECMETQGIYIFDAPLN